MIKINRRIELEDIVKEKDNWKQVIKNVPCYFKANYGKKFYITKKKKNNKEPYFFVVDKGLYIYEVVR